MYVDGTLAVTDLLSLFPAPRTRRPDCRLLIPSHGISEDRVSPVDLLHLFGSPNLLSVSQVFVRVVMPHQVSVGDFNFLCARRRAHVEDLLGTPLTHPSEGSLGKGSGVIFVDFINNLLQIRLRKLARIRLFR